MKKIIIVLGIILALLIITVVFFSKKEDTTIKNIERESAKEENLKKSLDGGIDYQYYYKYDKNFGCNFYSKDNLVYHIFPGVDEWAPVIVEFPTADKNSFQALDFEYAKDNNHAYNVSGTIESADPKTFEAIYTDESKGCPESVNDGGFYTGYAKDKNYVYYSGDIVDGLDGPSFEILGNRYLKTKDGIFISLDYNKIEQIKDADVNSFEVAELENGPAYVNSKYDAKDKNHFYKKGKIIE